jgi:hypothetical protein
VWSGDQGRAASTISFNVARLSFTPFLTSGGLHEIRWLRARANYWASRVTVRQAPSSTSMATVQITSQYLRRLSLAS